MSTLLGALAREEPETARARIRAAFITAEGKATAAAAALGVTYGCMRAILRAHLPELDTELQTQWGPVQAERIRAASVDTGRTGGVLGGPARAAALSPAQRKEIASKGGRATACGETAKRHAKLRVEQASRAGCIQLRIAQQTGTVVGVYLSGPGFPVATPWATKCDDHGTIAGHATRQRAVRAAAEPRAWCGPCDVQRRASGKGGPS